MDDLNIIDQFTQTFVTYIESGFGLLGPDVTFLTTILIGIDITLAGLFWAFSEDRSILPSLIKKVLYVGAFAFILNNFSDLATIIFESFAGLGLRATGSPISADDLMRPGFVAATGYDAAAPLLEDVSDLIGPIAFFENFVTIAILMFAWVVVLLAFFILAIQLFITILEFKLTTLAGFVLVPFALWNKTAFLAERVLGNVIAAGIKLMVLAVIVGIGSTLFGTFAASFSGGDITLEQAASTVLGALSIFMLGIFGPGIAAGLVSGAPQLGAGAAAGSAAGLALGGAATAGAAVGGVRALGSAAGGAVRAAASMGGAAAAVRSPGATGVASAAMTPASGIVSAAGASQAASAGSSQAPEWARKLHRRQRLREGATVAAHTLRDGDRPASGENPKLKDDD
ncbi:P-type conjugative transfer protein TrbL [Hoeflea poritis]|uniref:P-type conjugative transfer protein TrbL n=1 Tax=Hoeflea poritis TaxID=2993659 RepID=A0ABT4VV77_9HYPH|nr:P-type conjugative transfer protein TrbL [Hoeflea poritis]MDA4848606.1 P-type conjugative transfer protein TrbL [Hoeflea poritis]